MACLGLALVLLAGCQSTAATPSDPARKIAPEVTAALSRLESGQALDPQHARNDGDGRLQVCIYVTDLSAAGVQKLEASGLKQAEPSPPLGLVQGWVAPADIAKLAALDVVIRISLPHYAIHY